VRIPFQRAQPPKPKGPIEGADTDPVLAAEQRRRVIEYGSPDTTSRPPVGEEDRSEPRSLSRAAADDRADPD
jgi:hypothetical protein